MIKINRIKYLSHPILGDEEVKFVEKKEINNAPYLSLLIGQNGTGKSKVLGSIIDIILYLKKYSENQSTKWNEKYGFEIEFYNGVDSFELKYNNGDLSFNDQPAKGNIIALEKFLPSKVIAIAYAFNDNFLFPDKKNKSSIYDYFGIRTVSNAIFTRKPSEIVFNNLYQLIFKKQLEMLDTVFSNLGFKKRILVNYSRNTALNKLLRSTRFKKIMEIDIGNNSFKKIPESICENFSKIVKEITGLDKKERNKRFADDAIFRVLNDVISLKKHLFDFISELKHNNGKIRLEYYYSWEIENNENNHDFLTHKSLYDFLGELDLISFNYFSVSRDSFFDFNQASSGEFHFLHVYSALANNLEDNSIVLIDEPEISLHPNWQQSWYDLLKPLIYKHNSTHIIVSSHSHLIVSDLTPENSSINTLKRIDGKIIIEQMTKHNPFAWSTEQVLLDVFEMATDRNFYLAERMQSIVDELTKKSPDIEKVNKLRDELKQINRDNLDPKDPLNEVLKYLINEEVAEES